MIQCKDCEFCQIDSEGRRSFKCDPFVNVKEPECIAKWQLIRLDMLLVSYQGMLKWYGKLAPLQDKIIRYMQREINDLDETESWKLDVDEENEDPEDRRSRRTRGACRIAGAAGKELRRNGGQNVR